MNEKYTTECAGKRERNKYATENNERPTAHITLCVYCNIDVMCVDVFFVSFFSVDSFVLLRCKNVY